MKRIYLSIMLLFVGAMTFAQGNVSGTVTTQDGEASIGAIVRLAETSLGTITDYNGDFTITDVPAGNYNLTISSVGYDDYSQAVTISNGQTTNIGGLTLEGGSLSLEGVEIIADVAVDRKTPVAVSNIEGDFVTERLGNQEIGEVLTVTPSIYATKQGGGSGDSRIVVRGFDQRNTTYMINGVPVNDMENGWVYWSNWAGLGDVTSKIQVQRGLGASLLAVPSIGGTVNLITKTTDMKKGGRVYHSIGNDMYRKTGVTLSTGNINDWAITFSGSKTTGDGYVAGTFNDAYTWFGSISKDFDKHSLVLTGLGAPQRHGQRTFAYGLTQYVPNSGTGSYEDFIRNEKAGDHNSRTSQNSIRWNSSWGYHNGGILNAREDSYINERTNFYHKPQISLNHYWDVKDNIFVGTTIYGSWGRGGGTGPYGTVKTYKSAYRTGNNQNLIDWNAVKGVNASVTNGEANFATGEDFYLLRASMNEHNWYGAVTKGIFDVTDAITVTAGLDWRTYEGLHYRRPINLFGLNRFIENSFADDPTGKITVEDPKVFGISDEKNKIAYDNDGKVNWLGGFSELEYSKDALTLTLGGALSNKAYQRIDRRNYAANDPLRNSKKYNFMGYTAKGGANYNINDNHSVFGNVGYLSTAPIFGVVFPRFNNEDVNPDAKNEKTLGLEAGYKFRTGKIGVNLNGYYTNWKDKSLTKAFNNTAGDRFYANIAGIEALHKGLELDARIEATDKLGFNLMVAANDWKWKNNVNAIISDENDNVVGKFDTYIKDLKVGNAPQTQLAVMGDWEMLKGFTVDGTYRYFADYYADFNPAERDNVLYEGIQAVELPNYGLLDLGAKYEIDLNDNNSVFFRGNIYNALDKLYISDAQDKTNNTFDASKKLTKVERGSLENLSGYFGTGKTWTTTVGINFGETKPKAAKETVVMPAPAVEPVVIDTDGDGVIDAADMCPEIPGTVSGCPDTDGDGVVDSRDNCPEEAGTDKGCPVVIETPEPEVITETVTVTETVEVVPDADGDGVIDSKDKCPNVAGSVYNGGCPKPIVVSQPAPVTQQPAVQVVEKLNFIARSILFNTSSDVIKSESTNKLNEIASIMAQYPNADFVIEGHTDNTGNDSFNKTLSQKRANSVKNYLINKGVSSSRLTAIGYGEELPIADNNTAEGRKLNRRVVIKLR